MPHDVIMPALGMAQDTGKILSWLKQPGDPVAIGDPIMEVETDKAAMEVEAQAEGFLTHVSAEAGEDVPVGQVVAIISETADASAPSTANAVATPEAAPAHENPETNDLPEGMEIIMPALGMAQDAGLIVAWKKSPGDPVSEDDVLFEVETDKSVMEVPAGHKGFVAAILADADSSVPVGNVIAIISAEKPAAPFQRASASSQPEASPVSTAAQASTPPAQAKASPQKAAEAKSVAAPAKQARQDSWAKSASPAGIALPGGRILASPKAKWLAHQQGLDLSRLAENGFAPPYHVADLETLKSLPTAPLQAMGGQLADAALHIEARVECLGFEAFLLWLNQESQTPAAPRLVWLRFASSALRQVLDNPEQAILVETTDRLTADGCYLDADFSRLSQPLEEAEGDACLVLRDFSDSAIVSANSMAQQAPTVTIGRDKDDYVISFDYKGSQLSESQAFTFINAFAERLTNPLTHLL